MIQIIPNFLSPELFEAVISESRRATWELHRNGRSYISQQSDYQFDILTHCERRANIAIHNAAVRYYKRASVKYNPHVDYSAQLHFLIFLECPSVTLEQGTFFASGKQQEERIVQVAPVPNLCLIWPGPKHPVGGTFHGSVQGLYPNPQTRTTLNVFVEHYTSPTISGPVYKEGKQKRLLDWRASQRQLSDI